MKSVVFDFDFTLGDSSPAIVECFDCAMNRLGLPERAPRNIRGGNRLFGNDSPVIYVGDHPVDGQAPNAAGLEFIAVLTGMASMTWRAIGRLRYSTTCELYRMSFEELRVR